MLINKEKNLVMKFNKNDGKGGSIIVYAREILLIVIYNLRVGE